MPKCPSCDSVLLSIYRKKGTSGKDSRWITFQKWKYCETCDKIIEVKK